VTEGRDHLVSPIPGDGTDDVAPLAGHGVGAFHQREIAAGGGAQQRVEVDAGVFGNAYGGPPRREEPDMRVGLW
jgi:hypothetical protein